MIWKLTWKHLKSKPFSSFMTLVAVSLALALLGSFWTVIENLERVKLSHNSAAVTPESDEATGNFTVFVDSKLSTHEVDELRNAILQDKRFTSAEVISSGEAIKALEQQFGETLSKAFGGESLPVTIKVSFAKSVLSREEFLGALNSLRNIKGVLDVDDGTALISSAKSTFSEKIFSMATGLLIIVFLVVALLVSHLIRLAFESSRQEIETMKVLGAAKSWIFMPLLIEGLFFGVVGAFLSLGLLSLLVHFFISRYASFILPKGFDFVALSGLSSLHLVLLGLVASLLGTFLTWPLVRQAPREI